MVDGSGFVSRPGKPVNPRFSLNGDGFGQEVEDFSPKRPAVDRGSRPVPRRIGEQFPGSRVGSDVAPEGGSLTFGDDGGDDDIVLTRGVGDDAGVFVPVSPVEEGSDSPSVAVSGGDGGGVSEVVKPVTTFLRFADDSDESEIELDSDVESDSSRDVSSPVSPVSDTPFEGVSSRDVSETGEFATDDEAVSSSVTNVLPTRVGDLSGGDGVGFGISRSEKEDASAVSDSVSAPVSVRRPAVKPGVPRVNPLFADPVPDVEEDINLDVGVEESGSDAQKRPVNARFDFKVDRGNNVRGGEKSVLKNSPEALMDSEDASEFDKKATKKSSKNSKGKKSNRPGFSIQERDVTLLRFLTKYQFSYVDALARVLNSSPQVVTNRLRILEAHDLVKRQVIAAGSTLWQTRKAGIELAGLSFTENKKSISFATIRHTVGLVNLAAELEREAPDGKDILGLADKFGEDFPVMNRFPGGIRLYGDEVDSVDLTYGEMTVSEREIRQGQKRYRGGRSSLEMREMVELAVLSPEAPELEEGNEGLFVVYGSGGKTGEHVPDLIVTRPRNDDGTPNHFAIELELTAKSPYDWKRILRSYRDNGGMYSRIYYFTPDRPIANMIRNADEEVGLGDRLVIRKYTPKNKRQPFLG